MVRIANSLVAIGMTVIVASGCVLPRSGKSAGSRDTSGNAPLVYLQEDIPVCSAVAGSERDPCAVTGPPNLPSFSDIEYLRVPNY